MKKHIALLLALVLLLSACGTAHNDSTDPSSETNSTVLDNPNGTTEGTTATEGNNETSSAETTQGTENTEGTSATEESTNPSTGNSDPTQTETKPTTGSTTPTEDNTKPTTGNTDPTGDSTTKPTVGTTPTEPTTQPTTPTQPTTQPTVPPTTASLKINTKEDTVVLVGNTLQIDYTYTGNKSLTWTSGDTSVLTVDGSGKVTGKAAGWATVKVTDGTLTKRVTLEVKEQDTRPLATSLDDYSHNAPLYDGVTKYAGDYMTFKVNVQPDESNPNITVTSSNSSVVSVSWKLNGSSINEVTLNFKSAGTATVTITSADGNKSKSYSITVKSGYACNPGSGTLTPEQFVNAYNGVVSANGMSTSGMPTGYLVMTLTPQELTWSTARRNAEGRFHAWWLIGYRTLVLTYEGTNDYGSHVFYVRGY